MTTITVTKDENGKLVVRDGARFGLLVVIRKVKQEAGRDWWLCRCDCGNEKTIVGKSLRRRITNSCGCGVRAATRRRSITHGRSSHPLYKVWKNIRSRCCNKNTPRYADYGGRGIECLFRDAPDFIDWALAQGWRKGLTVDRTDNDGPYCRDNCRLVGMDIQNRNSRRNVVVVVRGKEMCFKDAAAAVGINYGTAMKRLGRYGCTPEQALGLEEWPRSRL